MSKNQFLILSHHIFLILGLIYYGFNFWYAIPIFLASMFWAKFVGSDIMHFYFAHGKYKDCLKSYFYTILTLCTSLGSPLSFSASHRQHHKHTDTEKDPHSPVIIGWKRVYLLDWKGQNISPLIIRDFITSKFQKTVHKYWLQFHIVIISLIALIDIRLICFLISPFIIYSFHASGLVNTLCHINGEPRNVHWQKFINWWGWDHGDHHEYELKNINNSN
jgi:stearoyl-CoA desaturase (Delta-9 desaturase)